MDLLNKLGKNINKYYTKAVREYEDVVQSADFWVLKYDKKLNRICKKWLQFFNNVSF